MKFSIVFAMTPKVGLFMETSSPYVWGDQAKTQKVWIGDSSYLEITDSAMAVLLYIATSEMDEYLWIDALCIYAS
jgi:hypothetical protein